MSNLSHQDWETVTLKKPIKQNKTTNTSPTKIPTEKLVIKETEKVNVRLIDQELKIALQSARINNKLTQKQVATSMNVKPATIMNYETGKAIPDNHFISKLERYYKTKLPRAKKITKEI